MKKKKLKQKDFEKVLKTNSKKNPFNIDDYDKQSIINCRLSKGKIHFYVKFLCNDCKTSIVLDTKHKERLSIDYLSYCSKCKRRISFKKHYGVDYYFQTEEFKSELKDTLVRKYGSIDSAMKLRNEKSKQTNLEKYGTEYPTQSNIIKNKTKQTCLEKYGTEHYVQTEEFKEKLEQTLIDRFGSLESAYKQISNKTKQTYLEKYGVESNLQLEETKNKIKETNLEKYGVEYYLQSKDLKEKSKQTSLNRYGVEHASQSDIIKEKARKTKLEKYGKLHFNHKYLFNNELFDSSWELAFYIYHLDKQHNIKHEPYNFSYTYNGEEHQYSVDFKVSNKYYEIKGDQFIMRYKNGNIKGMVCPYDRDKDDLYNAKYKCMKKHKVNVISDKEITKYLKYIEETYGSLDYLEQYRINENKL